MSREVIQIAVFGAGYWGEKVIRNFCEHPGFEVLAVVDPSLESRQRCQSRWPRVKCVSELDDNIELDAVVIATPPASHFKLAKRFLDKGLHVLVEKPLAIDSEDCRALNLLAKEKKRVLMVDHTYLFQSSLSELIKLGRGGRLGKLLYFDSVRVNLGGIQPEVNVLWDLAPHDLSILDALRCGVLPESVIANGVDHYGLGHESLCYLTLRYSDQFIANINLNWASPVKVRKITLAGSEKMATFDDSTPEEQLKIYDCGVQIEGMDRGDYIVNYRTGSVTTPAFIQREPLAQMASAFHQAIQGADLLSDGEMGLRVSLILEAASKSLAEKKAVAIQ